MHQSGGTGEPRGPGRVVLPGGLRSRLMAPFYALTISFAAVLLLGAVVREPAAAPPTAAQVNVRLVTATGQDGEQLAPAAGLAGALVHVLADGGRDLRVDSNGGLAVPASGTPLTICVRLPAGWTAPRVNTRLMSGFSCWERQDPTGGAEGRIDLVVAGPVADR